MMGNSNGEGVGRCLTARAADASHSSPQAVSTQGGIPIAEHSPLPWSLHDDGAGSLKVLCANGGVVALLKAAGGRKAANGAAIIEWANGVAEAIEARDFYAGLYAQRCGDLLRAQGTSASGQDAKRLEAKPAGPVAEGHAP